jgi:hypothetical protein
MVLHSALACSRIAVKRMRSGEKQGLLVADTAEGVVPARQGFALLVHYRRAGPARVERSLRGWPAPGIARPRVSQERRTRVPAARGPHFQGALDIATVLPHPAGLTPVEMCGYDGRFDRLASGVRPGSLGRLYSSATRTAAAVGLTIAARRSSSSSRSSFLTPPQIAETASSLRPSCTYCSTSETNSRAEGLRSQDIPPASRPADGLVSAPSMRG